MRDQLYVIDSMSLIYRALHQRGPKLSSPDGEPVSATLLFCKMLFNILDAASPAYLALAIDVPRSSTFRRKLYHGYKLVRDGRPPACEDSKTQIRRCLEIINKLGGCVIERATFEADDVIASLVHTCASDEVEAVVVTRDKDLHQVVGPNCRLYDHQTGAWTTEADVINRWGFPPKMVVQVQTLIGDPGDGVPGVHGIGPETAKKLLKRYGTIEGIMDHIDDINPGARRALKAADLTLCRQLVHMRTDVPLNVSSEDLEFDGIDRVALKPLFNELGLDRWL